MAKEAGIDIANVRGTGAGGEIQTADVQAFIDAKTSQAAPAAGSTSSTLSAVGRLMAERTTQSWTTVPHFFLQKEVDASTLNELRRSAGPAIEKSHGIKLTHTDLLIALVAHTLARHPRVNASWIGDSIHTNPDVNIALAMAVEGGVVSAVISKADGLPLSEIARQRHDLSERARAGRLRPCDLAGATFTISNLGMFHIDSFSAIIVQPQAAILAVGSIAERVVAVDGRPVVQPMLSLTLSSDHRVLDGATAASFLRDLAAAIRSPSLAVTI
jgi:pyruvate dehydrogenase E2 component (dihydrolipoamide acetyltransferase)